MIEIICILLGIPIGYLIRNNASLAKNTDYALSWSVRILLFLLGLSQGANANLLVDIHTLTFQTLVFSISCIAGSLLAAKILEYFIHPKLPTI